MKQYLMVFGLAYALGGATVLVVGHKSSSAPVCEIQSQPSEPLSSTGSCEGGIFPPLEANPFRITACQTEVQNEASVFRASAPTLVAADSESAAIGAIHFFLGGNSGLWFNSGKVLDRLTLTDPCSDAIEQGAYMSRLQSQFHGTLIIDDGTR